jgi:hypothetical protein
MNIKKKQSMKKHQVDDLFARRLADWQPKASPDLWKRIEDRQVSKVQRLRGWYWYAAASVALLLMVGYVTIWKRQPGLPQGLKREIATVGQIRQSKEMISDSGSIFRNSAEPLWGGEESESNTVEQSLSLPIQKVETLATKETTIDRQIDKHEPPSKNIEVATIQKNAISPEVLIQENKSNTLIESLDISPETTKESLAEQAKGRVIIAHVEIDELHQEDQRSSKFIRILRQLKNAKQGEAIEWEEVGFNPKKMMARADERLRNEEEKVSKKYQELKDKTTL